MCIILPCQKKQREAQSITRVYRDAENAIETRLNRANTPPEIDHADALDVVVFRVFAAVDHLRPARALGAARQDALRVERAQFVGRVRRRALDLGARARITALAHERAHRLQR